MKRFTGLVLLAFVAAGWVSPARADVKSYVAKADPYVWKEVKKEESLFGTVVTLHLESQTWQGHRWEHDLQIFVPKGVKPGKTMVLWNQGGKAGIGGVTMGMGLATKIQAPVAFLYGIPMQPLFDGKKEDALIAETFVRYIATKDESWPLLFPMVKSLVRAMDTLQEYSEKAWDQKVEKFVVTGASKRGWTTWLTAVVDPRVMAIAPMVIDTLNFREQAVHSVKSFGAPSEQVADYTRLNLDPNSEVTEAKRLWDIVDPYFYRDELKLPKLLINGNNDPYWTVDALNLYWDGLKGPKWISYSPNAGHNLQEKKEDGKSSPERAINALAAFCRAQIKGEELPKLAWKHTDENGKPQIVVACDRAPKSARIWVAAAPTKDFRKFKWESFPATVKGTTVEGSVDLPKEGCLAFYAEVQFQTDEDLPYSFCTQVRVVGEPKK